MSSTNLNKKKKGFKMPETAALLMLIILFGAVLSYIVPAGEYERVFDEATNRTLVVAGTFSRIEQTPVGVGQILSSIYRGFIKAADIIALVFIVGGAFGLVARSGAINAGLEKLIRKFSGRETIIVAIIMTAFAICGATYGMAEDSLALITIVVTASLALGFDEIVGVSMVVVGIYCGYSAGPLNPFNTGIAQGIAELPLFSGIGLRIVLMAGALIIAIHHTTRYGKKIKRNKLETKEGFNESEKQFEMTLARKVILGILTATIIALILGVLRFGWYIQEMTSLFLAMGIIVGMINYKGDFNKFSVEFLKGAGEMTTAAIFIAFSRAILVVMQDGNIMDTLVYGISVPLRNLNSIFAAWGIYVSQGIINFAIPSSTGQAVVVMPIMSSLSDIIGINRQVAVLAYQAGDGYWNMITPTHSVVMASLGLAGVSFNKWFKFAAPLVAKWTVWILIILAVAVTTGWGPF